MSPNRPCADDRAVSVVIDSLIAFYALEPLMQELSARGVHQHVYCVPGILERIATLLQDLPRNSVSITALVDDQRTKLYLHRLLRQLATRPSFSYQYRLFCDPRQFPGDWRYWATAQVARLSPGLPHHKVNQALARIVGPLTKPSFATSRVLTVSRTSVPHLLCSPGLAVTTLLESWDHPVKWPVGHRSKAVFVWNRDLARDWQQYQGDLDVSATYPLKLRYWIEGRFPNRDSFERRVAVYAVGTSSMSYMNEIHRYEMEVIEAVCEATRRAGWRLLIKPKPNGKAGDFDRFTASYDHVSLGAYRDVKTPSDYYLDDEYNRQRQAELATGDLVINAVTTFGLDAALYGVPCLQLDLRNCPEFKGIAAGQTNHHIAQYLLGTPQQCLVAKPGQLVAQLAAFLTAPDGRAAQLRDRLREWLRPEAPLAQSLSAMADRLLQPVVHGQQESTPAAAAMKISR